MNNYEIINIWGRSYRITVSVLLFDIYAAYLLEKGVEKSNIIKINLENIENIKLRNPLVLYEYIKGRIANDNKYYVMIDEIQYVDEFEDLVNSLKNMGVDVYITGLNSKLLSGDISTKLRGRSIEIKVYPPSFSEFYSFRGGDKQNAYNEYQMYGGFPYAATETDFDLKVEYLKMLEGTVATKDIIDRYGIRNPNLFDAVYSFLCSNIGSIVSAKKISDTLRTNGYSTITADTVGNYLEYLCEAFLFYKVYRYDIKGKEYLKTLNKYYISDIGLRNCKLQFRQLEVTHTLENIIYQELIRRGYMVDIGKNKDKEIDFIAKNSKDTFYIQAAYSIADPNKKEQEIKGGMLITSMVGISMRSTMDIDTTVKGQDLSLENVQRIVSEIVEIQLDDGISFNIKDVETIMDEMEYPGIRFHLDAVFEKMVTPIKIDVSTGDVITPRAIEYNYKLILEEREIDLWSYNLETILGEKLQTISFSYN